MEPIQRMFGLGSILEKFKSMNYFAYSIFVIAFWAISSCNSTESDTNEPDNAYEKSYKTYTDAVDTLGTLNIMTYNILWDKATTSKTQWSYRREEMVNLIQRHNPDIIGVQEGFINQDKYLKNQLGDEYFGYGTDDGLSESADPAYNESLNPIFYNPNRLKLLDRGVFWYSDDPSYPNLGFCTGSTDTHFRNCVWGKFQEKGKDGRNFYVYNTHFALIDDVREQQAYLLLDKIKEIAGRDACVFVTGDFNSDPYRDNSYSVLTDTSLPIYLNDSKNFCSSSLVGPSYTGSGLTVGSRTSGYEVDHIFVRNIRLCTVHKIITDYEGDYYPSDHFPVLAVMSFE